MEKKGQASTEYLIILAVVVIVALAVVGVLGGFPTVSKGISEKDAATYWQSADIAIVRYYANQTGTYAILRNNKNFAVKLQNQSSSTWSDLRRGLISPTLSPGESTVNFVMLLNNSSSGAYCASPGAGTFTVGVSDLAFNYTDPTYGTIYIFSGIKPLVGSC
jgi:hypothetical protein